VDSATAARLRIKSGPDHANASRHTRCDRIVRRDDGIVVVARQELPMPEALDLETRVRKVEDEVRETSTAAAVHFVELRDFFQDGLRSLSRQVRQLSTRVDGLSTRVDLLAARMDERFAKVDKRFEQIDKRFEQIDKRFEQIDKRFEQIDKRFEQIDKRFEQIDKRFEQIDKRFDRLEAKLDLFIQTQGGINRSFERRLRRLEKRLSTPKRLDR
jgi:chromosome segregation ATPase